MGLTIEIYSADLQELVALFAEESSWAYEDVAPFLEKLETHPVADLSLHLRIPEDMDSLCEALRKQHLPVPSTFRDMLIEQLWVDRPKRPTESLTLLANRFASALAESEDHQIEHAALDWAATFPYTEPLQKTPAYQAMLRLREIAKDAVDHQKSLILHLVG